MFVPTKEHMRDAEVHKGVKANTEATSIQSTNGGDILDERSCRNLFSFFRSRDFSLKTSFLS